MAAKNFLLTFVVLSLIAMATAELRPQAVVLTPLVKIQASVFCIIGETTTPIEGATIKAECELERKYKPVEIISEATDGNGFILTTIPTIITGQNVLSCNIKLDASPLAECNVALNINNGIVGVTIPIINNDEEIISIPPFFFQPA